MDAYDRAETSNRPMAVNAIREEISRNPKWEGWQLYETPVTAKTRFDLWLQKGDSIILIEHKHRFYASYAFPEWQLNGRKVNALRGMVNGNVKAVWYCNTFTDGKFAIWNVTKEIGQWRWSKPHNRKTVEKSEMVKEYDLFLKISEAGLTNIE